MTTRVLGASTGNLARVQALVDAESVRREADDYIINALAALEGELNRLLAQARNGISKLNADRQRMLRSPEDMETPKSS